MIIRKTTIVSFYRKHNEEYARPHKSICFAREDGRVAYAQPDFDGTPQDIENNFDDAGMDAGIYSKALVNHKYTMDWLKT